MTWTALGTRACKRRMLPRRAHSGSPGRDGAGHRAGSAGAQMAVPEPLRWPSSVPPPQPVRVTSEMKKGCGNQGPRTFCGGDGGAPRFNLDENPGSDSDL